MYKKQLTVILVLLFACVLCLGACTANNGGIEENDGIISSITNPTQLLGSVESILKDSASQSVGSDYFKATDNVWVIIETEGQSAAESYLASTGYKTLGEYIASEEGQAHVAVLTETQNKVKELLDKQNLVSEYDYSYTTLNNGFAAYVQYGDIEMIKALPHVEEVIISDIYSIPTTSVGSNNYSSYDSSTGMLTNNSGYNGEGMTIGVIDSGFDYTHPAFQKLPENPCFSYDDIASFIPYLTASTIRSFTVSDVYRSAKVPFTFDYADRDTDTNTPSGSTAGYHGTHVSGIVAGDNDVITGSASQAQILAFKVFPNYSAGASKVDIVAALNDAAIIGVDAVNLSLGSAGGFASEIETSVLFLNDIYETLRQLGIAVIAAAGNNGAVETEGMLKDGAVSIENPEYGTIGSPASYSDSMSVASAYSLKYDYFTANGRSIALWNAAYPDGTKINYSKLILNGADAANLQFVAIGGTGDVSDFEGVDVAGKIALIQRGTLSFSEKARNAQNAGAIGVIIYNNVTEHINAQIETDIVIPVCTIDMESGAYLLEMLENGENEVSFGVNNQYFPTESYSSWGPLSDLTLKPDITAPGGDIYSAIPTSMYSSVGSYYGYLSGTSMASPNLAGTYLDVKQYIKANFSGLTEIEMRTLAYRLMMSTATIMYDGNGNVVTPRKQGAGMVNVDSVVASKAYLSVTGSERTKLSLGDDKNRDGIYTLRFNLVNMSSDAVAYDIDVITIAEGLTEDKQHLSLSSYTLEKSLKVSVANGSYENGIVTVEANETAKITIVITLNDSAIEYLNQFPNGTYVEGYAVFANVEEDGVNLGIPYLVFYGDWTEASAFDKSFYGEDQNVFIEGNGGILVLTDYYWDYDNEEAYYENHYLGAYDQYAIPEGFTAPATSADRVAMSLTEGGYNSIYTIVTILLRDVHRLSYTIRDQITGVEYWVGQAYQVGKCYTDGAYYYVTAYGFELDISTLPVSNNQQLEVVIRAELNYEGCNQVQEQIVTLFIDDEAPVLKESTIREEEGRTYLELDMFDNHYLDNFALATLDAGGQVTTGYGYAFPAENWVKGRDNKVTLDITDYLGYFNNGELVVTLRDCAGNTVNYYAGNVYGETSEEESEVNGFVNNNVNDNFNMSFGSDDADFTTSSITTDAEFASDDVIVSVNGDAVVATAGEHKFTVVRGYLTGYEGPGGYVVIPDDLGIRYIQRTAFEKNTDITGVEVPEGVRSLLICTFFDCYNLEKVVLPSTLTYIGNSVFYDNVKLTSLNLEDTRVNNYGAAVFANVGLKELVIPDPGSNVVFGMWMIQHCAYLEKLVVECNVSSTNQSIMDCPALKEVIFNGDVAAFTGNTLYGAYNLERMEFNGYVGSIGNKYADYDLSFSMLGVKEIHFKGDVGSIYGSCFSNCRNLEKVVFYGSVDYISGGAFTKSNITSFTIAEGNDNLVLDEETGIMYNADMTSMFVPGDWDYVGVLELPETLEVIPDYAFGAAYMYLMAYSLTIKWDYEGGGGYLKAVNYGWGYDTTVKSITGIVFPENVSEIKKFTFNNCQNLEYVEFSDGITNIGQYAFRNCYKIENLNNLDYVENVGNYAFYNCYNLRELEFSEDMTSIGDYAFYNCFNLTKVEAPGVCDYLGTSAFENCYNLEVMTVSEDLEEIYYYAFKNCYNLKEFIAPGVYWLGAEAFRDCVSLERVELSDDLCEIYDYTFYNCWNLAEINEFSSLEYIAKYAFANTTCLNSFYFSDCIYYIGNNAFEYSGLTELVFNSDISFPANAFRGLSLLETIDFAEDTSYYAFVDGIIYSADMTEVILCPARMEMEGYVLPETVDTINDYAFFGSRLTEINLENVYYVGNYAFYASELKELTIHGDMTIAPYAFGGVVLDKLTISADADFFDYISVFESAVVDEYVIEENSFIEMNGDYLMSKDGSVIYKYFGTEANVVIPEGVKVIGERAFEGNEYLVNLTLPTTLKAIGSYAFDICENLETIIFKSEEAPALYTDGAYYNFGFGMEDDTDVVIYTPNTDSYKTYVWKNLFSTHYLMIDGAYVEWDKNVEETAENNVANVQNANNAYVASVAVNEYTGIFAAVAGFAALMLAAAVISKKSI